MSYETTALMITAASIGFLHTLFGPDHYLPFIVMSTARNWSLTKTMTITILCGVGHVLSSVVLGFVGIALGIAVTKLEVIEGTRGEIAAWAFIAFGFFYMVWGIHRAIKNKPHTHIHIHEDGSEHNHEHSHAEAHAHLHNKAKPSMTPWILFTIFVLGPCEPLIPLLMYPAATKSTIGVFLVAGVFSIVTISTMLSVVLLSYFGISFLPMKKLERYVHALAGATICLSGCAIQFLGL